MAITDRIPWKHKESERQPEERGLATRQDSFLTFQQQMNQVFDKFFEGWGMEPYGASLETGALFSPRVDVAETDGEIKVSLELPGLKEEDIDVSLSRDVLTIRGEKRREEEEKGRNYYRSERSFGSFQRSVPLPAPVDAAKTEAVYRKGVLTVTLPKARVAEDRKQITVKPR